MACVVATLLAWPFITSNLKMAFTPAMGSAAPHLARTATGTIEANVPAPEQAEAAPLARPSIASIDPEHTHTQRVTYAPQLQRTKSAAPPSHDARALVRAQLLPKRFTLISSEVSGKVMKLAVQESGRFQKGSVLARLDCQVQVAQRERVLAEFQQAQRLLQANETLNQLQAIGSMELDQSRASFQKYEAELKMASASLQKCEIRAPFDGRVAELKIREQQVIQPGQPVMEIIDDSELELEFIAPSHWLQWAKVGSVFQVRIDEVGQIYEAKLTRIGARIDPVSQTIKLTGQIKNKDRRLLAGMSGDVYAGEAPEVSAGASKPAVLRKLH